VVLPATPPSVVLPAVVVPPPPVLVAPTVAIREISDVIPRAFVAGEDVRLAGAGPPGCDPYLTVDGQRQGSVPVGNTGAFDLAVLTRDLAAGQHVAEVLCTHPSAALLRTTFWIAAAQTSSDIFFVVVASLLVVVAVGWVCLRTLAGGSGLAAADRGGQGP
jgi:hypothetical protein